MSTVVTLNFGDTFHADCTYRDASGDPVNLEVSGIVVTAEVRTPDGVRVADCEVTILDQNDSPGCFTLTADTDAWVPVRTSWFVLIRYRQSSTGEKFSSRRIEVKLQ